MINSSFPAKIGINFLIKLLGLLLGYFNLILITKHFGAFGFGVYSICFTVLSIMQVISKFGMDTSIIKLVNQIDFSKGRIIKNLIYKVTAFVLIIGLFCSITLHYLTPTIIPLFNDYELVKELRLIAIVVVPFSLIFLFSSIFQSIDDVKSSMILRHLLVQLIFCIFLLVNQVLGLNYGIITVFCFAVTLSFLVAFVLLVTRLKNVDINLFKFSNISNDDIISTKKIISLSFSMLLSTSIFFIMGWTDNLMLGSYVSETDVGYFNACLKLSMVISVSLVVVNSIIVQKIASNYAQNNMAELKLVVKTSSKYIFYLSIVPFMALLLFPKSLLSFFGNEFTESTLTLILLSIGQLFNALCGLVGMIMQMCGLHKQHQYIVVFTAILNALINYLLIPKYGILGAAIANTISTGVWNILMVIIVKNKLGFWTFYRPNWRTL